MKSILLAIVICFVTIGTSAQEAENAPKQFVIKGKAVNTDSDFWEFILTGFFDNRRISVPYNENGEFLKTVTLKHPQDIYLYLNNDAITIFAVPGDTISLNWDNKNFSNTFKISSPQSSRQSELDLMMQLYKKFRQPFLQLMRNSRSREIPDSTKFGRIYAQFKERIGTIMEQGITNNTEKIVADSYFRYIDIMSRAKLLNEYDLSLEGILSDSVRSSIYFDNVHYKSLNEYIFYESYNYRDFIFDQTRFSDPFNSMMKIDFTEKSTTNFVLQDCYLGLGFLKIKAIKDWYLAKAIMFGFDYYNFDDAEEAYNEFLPMIKTQEYKDALKEFYGNIQNLKPGNPAPDFTLKDLNGNEVSLNDFKGKVVYIDFWGVYCGPCRYDLKNYSPKMHEKYKDKDLVFLNICVDVDESGWRKGVEDLQVKGVNLLAEGWTSNPVCRKYNINAIPHYVLIDKKGNLVNNNAPRPGRLIGDRENELDKLLAQ